MICTQCKEDKTQDDFYTDKSTRTRTGRHSACKVCRNKQTRMSKYNISEGFIDYLYSYTECMCCGTSFKNNRHRHIHHTEKEVQGLVCRDCNYILRGETDLDLEKIKSVLVYMHSDRKILCRLSEIPTRACKHKYSATECSSKNTNSRYCNSCKNFYTENSFCIGHQNMCRECGRGMARLTRSKPVKEAKQKTTHCECCNTELKEKHIHHIGDIAYGIVCNHCNNLLRDESKEQIDRLLSAKLWMEQESLDWVMT